MTMQQQALEPNAVMITTTDEVLCIDKEEQLSQSNALPKKSDSSPLMVDSFSPKSLPNKTKNKPIIPPHKKDTRKLFVGGLGKQGEMSKFFLHTGCSLCLFFEKYEFEFDALVYIFGIAKISSTTADIFFFFSNSHQSTMKILNIFSNSMEQSSIRLS
jgi:hypothetical protein